MPPNRYRLPCIASPPIDGTLAYIGALQRRLSPLEGPMPKRIFIIDDSKIVRQYVRTHLETRSDHVVCAEAVDGLDAIRLAGEVKPDVIVIDLCMPRMDGMEAAAILHGMLPRVPIILYTLHKEIVSEKRAQAAGIRSVVSKMDQIDVLLGEIQNFMGAARSATA
jgi:CheY-like chemotaxis protein